MCLRLHARRITDEVVLSACPRVLVQRRDPELLVVDRLLRR
jgi:hypothetical protein